MIVVVIIVAICTSIMYLIEKDLYKSHCYYWVISIPPISVAKKTACNCN